MDIREFARCTGVGVGLLAALLIAGSCGDNPLAPTPGTFTLTAVTNESGQAHEVPVTLPLASGDSIRYIDGAFVLTAAGEWEVEFEEEFRPSDGDPQRRDGKAAGRYEVREAHGSEGVVLDLYPDRPITADRVSVAVLKGDTLHYGSKVFLR